jgi:hypothetical protein
MFCDEVLERVEAIAAKEQPLDDRLSAHLRECPGCSTVLEKAVRLERLLTARPVPKLPPQFAARTMTRLRRDRWRREQFVDTIFNVSLGLAVVAVIGAVWAMVDGSGFAAITRNARTRITGQLVELAGRAAPSLGLYTAAAALIGAVLALWWWAERE